MMLMVPHVVSAFLSPSMRGATRQALSRSVSGSCKTSCLQATIEPTDLFSSWAETGRDEVMAAGHNAAVTEMLKELEPHLEGDFKQRFSFLDVGCGNGWVVRRMMSSQGCERAMGVDGAKEMIRKAKRMEEQTAVGASFTCQNIVDFECDKPFDVVMSMEVLYYLKEEEVATFLKNLSERILTKGGLFVLGLDHFAENESCHDWAKVNNTRMLLWTAETWQKALESAGFEIVKGPWRAAEGREGMPSGTLAFIVRS